MTTEFFYIWRDSGGGGDRGREPGKIRAGHGREAGGDGSGSGSHARAGGGKRMRDNKFFNDFLVHFLSKLTNIKAKEHWLFIILTGIQLYWSVIIYIHHEKIRYDGLKNSIAKLVERRREAGDNSKKIREAEEEVREVGDVYPPVPPMR